MERERESQRFWSVAKRTSVVVCPLGGEKKNKKKTGHAGALKHVATFSTPQIRTG